MQDMSVKWKKRSATEKKISVRKLRFFKIHIGNEKLSEIDKECSENCYPQTQPTARSNIIYGGQS